MPARAHPTDVGYDLTLVTRKDFNWGPNIQVYGTEVYIQPETADFYFEVVPRSSIVKTPYILANSTGVIDPSYTGEILVVLRKVDTERPDLELPARVAQLIPRTRHSVSFKVEELEQTQRGAGGFGSSGN